MPERGGCVPRDLLLQVRVRGIERAEAHTPASYLALEGIHLAEELHRRRDIDFTDLNAVLGAFGADCGA